MLEREYLRGGVCIGHLNRTMATEVLIHASSSQTEVHHAHVGTDIQMIAGKLIGSYMYLAATWVVITQEPTFASVVFGARSPCTKMRGTCLPGGFSGATANSPGLVGTWWICCSFPVCQMPFFRRGWKYKGRSVGMIAFDTVVVVAWPAHMQDSKAGHQVIFGWHDGLE